MARWVALAHARMAAQPQILGASCQGQTTIAKIGFQRRQVTGRHCHRRRHHHHLLHTHHQLLPRRQLPLKTSYLYALVGSHGFVLSPHHRHTLLEVCSAAVIVAAARSTARSPPARIVKGSH